MAKPNGDYRRILQEEFEARCARNSRYSLRAFARDLGLSPGGLSQLLNGQMGLSRERVTEIARRLGMTGEETERFRDLVLSRHARSEKERKLARVRLRKHETAPATLQLDAFKAISDWYHLAILELTGIEGFRSDPKWIAAQLGTQVKAVEMAIERLKRLDLLEERDGALRQTVGVMATPSGIPSDAIKRFHEQVLEKARAALFIQPLEERDFASVILPVRASSVAKAKEKLRDMRRALVHELESEPGKDRVYCLSVQFFSLHQKTVNQEI